MSLRSGPPPSSSPTCTLVLACALLCGFAAAARAEPESEALHWVPAVGVASGVWIQKNDASVGSALRGFFEDDLLRVYPLMEGSFELMSPALFEGLVQPRLFVRGGFGGNWDALHRDPKEGDAGRLDIPAFSTGLVPLEAVKGQGSEARLQAKPFFYTASAGLALSLPFDGERALRVKTSVEYRYGATQIEALISAAESIADDELCPCRLGRLAVSDEEDQHALGAGLELELDAARIGPFLLAIHLHGQAHRLLEGRTLRASALGTFDDDVTPIDVSSRARLAPWSFRLGVGVRFRWFPERL